MDLDAIHTILQRDCLLDSTKPVLVGVSGGPDSLCLLDVLHRLGYSLVVGHLNHGLRPEAGRDAQEVADFARALDVPFVLGEEDVGAYARQNASSIEEAARTLRYRFLFAQARRLGAQAVAVGHSADDQVETVLMHLLRGAGLAGLKGMQFRTLPTPWSEHIPLVRPLLSIWREQILSYCQERGIRPVVDLSNLDTTFFRNRLRHELIPYLQGYAPRLPENLLRMAQVLNGDYQLIMDMVAVAWKTCLVGEGPGYLLFDLRSLKDQPVAVQRHLLRQGIAVHRPGLRDIDFAAVERALAFLDSPSRSGQCDLIAGLRLVYEGDHLCLATWEADLPAGEWPQVPQGESLHLDVPGNLFLPGGWCLVAEIAPQVEIARQQAYTNADPYQAWADAERARFPLVVRSRHPGDRLRPFGMGGRSIKLANFMINVKLPRRARRAWPLVCSQGNILWVPGYRLAHDFGVTHSTQRVLWLHLDKEVA